ncbi:MAG: hypothetical protein KF712_07335 [Akkermansiaceae bacterium]|nr:hypothetical protein [Akkermansiaceae bacterium]
MKSFPTLLAVLVSSACLPLCQAAIIASYDFSSGLASGDSETTSTASDIQSGGGLGAVADGWGRSGTLSDLYIRSSVTSDTLTPDDYISFTVTADPGTSYNFTSLTFKYSVQVATSGPVPISSNAVVRSSLDNFATNLGTFAVMRTASGTTTLSPGPSVDLSAYTNVSGAVEFRIYVFDDVDAIGSQSRFDNIILNATIVPEMSGVSLVAFGSLLLAWKRRR